MKKRHWHANTCSAVGVGCNMCWAGFKGNQFPKEELTVLQSEVAFSDKRWAGMGIMLVLFMVDASVASQHLWVGNWF